MFFVTKMLTKIFAMKKHLLLLLRISLATCYSSLAQNFSCSATATTTESLCAETGSIIVSTNPGAGSTYSHSYSLTGPVSRNAQNSNQFTSWKLFRRSCHY